MNDVNDSTQVELKQFPTNILAFSSQYGSNTAQSYVVSNICTHQQIFPSYGDSTHALVFRTYGPWWLNLPSYIDERKHFQRVENDFTSRDFIDIEYKHISYNCKSLNIYETYNPGSLEVVYAGEEKGTDDIKWHRVWKYPEPFSIVLRNDEEIFIENGRQQMGDIFPNHINTAISALNSLYLNTDNKEISKIYTHHTYPPAARFPRILKIPLKNKFSFPTRYFRLEFDHCTTNYYIEIDTIVLCSDIQTDKISSTIENIFEHEQIVDKEEEQKPEMKCEINFSDLPFDILFMICSRLDLRSLMRLSSTCRVLRERCLHQLQFLSLNLQPYWNGITNQSIENFFLKYTTKIRYLSLAWTKSIQYSAFHNLLTTSSENVLQLNLACCQYLNGDYIKTIVDYCPNIQILNLQNCTSLNNMDFIPLINLRHLRSLNVYRTKIDYQTLLQLIDNNKEHFQDINIGSCQRLIDTIGIVKLLFARCPKLRSIDIWRLYNLTANTYLSIAGLKYDIDEENNRLLSLTEIEQHNILKIYSLTDMPVEIKSLSHLTCLAEIDIGWTDPPGGFVRSLVEQAGHSLIKIFLTACRRISNTDVIAISQHCPRLRQLDLLGSNIIVEDVIELVLQNCSNIEFIDLSFCSKISDAAISRWISQYKGCFKRSYSPVLNDDVFCEFP